VTEDPDAKRIAGTRFRVVIAGLAVVTREREPFSAPLSRGRMKQEAYRFFFFAFFFFAKMAFQFSL
jgi:hypothetical protein